MKAIVNGKIILEDEIVLGRALVISDRIEDIVSEKEIPDGCEIIDAKGGYVAPGLIDLHIHGYMGRDVCDALEDSLQTISEGIVKNGVTAFLPTTMTVDMELIKKVIDTVRASKKKGIDKNGARILGCHAEGPFISKSKKGAQEERHILPPSADFVLENADIIKIITLAPEEDCEFKEIRKICENTQAVVSMGHTSADYGTAIKSIDAGVSHATHLFNAMSPLTHRAPGVVGAALNTDVSCELIVDTFHVSPVLYDTVYKLKGRKLVFITDCLSAGGLPEGEYTLGGQKIIYDGNICTLEDGTIAGSVLKLNEGVWNVYKNSRIPLNECVNAASLNPATVLGLQDKKGSIKVGKDADIIITDNNFRVKATIIEGEIKYEFKG